MFYPPPCGLAPNIGIPCIGPIGILVMALLSLIYPFRPCPLLLEVPGPPGPPGPPTIRLSVLALGIWRLGLKLRLTR